MNICRFFVPLLALVSTTPSTVVSGQDVIPPGTVAKILPHLSKERPLDVSFLKLGAFADPKCGLVEYKVSLSRGSARQDISVMSEPETTPSPFRAILASLKRLRVDADGSPRAYHPEDPDGTGACSLVRDKTGAHYPQDKRACAIDRLSNAGVLLFKGANRVPDARFVDEWLQFWPLIRERRLRSLKLAELARDSSLDQYYLFYSTSNDTTAIFRDRIIKRDPSGYPCIRGVQSRFSGYFIASTSLKYPVDHFDVDDSTVKNTAPAECGPLRNINSELTPYFVLPAGVLGPAGIGDIVIGQLTTGGIRRRVYAIAADEGPVSRFGEASIAFNQQLAGVSGPVLNNKGLNALDIDDGRTIAVIVFPGTRSLLKGDFSVANIETIGKELLATWERPKGEGRLDACISKVTASAR